MRSSSMGPPLPVNIPQGLPHLGGAGAGGGGRGGNRAQQAHAADQARRVMDALQSLTPGEVDKLEATLLQAGRAGQGGAP